ncbi:MAG: ATP-binding protein [Bacteroidota bacterium]
MLRYLSELKTRTIIAVTIIVAALLLSSAYFELQQSRQELFHVLEEHSRSLAGTIANSSANIVLSTDQIEAQLSERLLNNARLIALMDSLGQLDAKTLTSIARRNGIFRVNIFNKKGNKILSNHAPEPMFGAMQPNGNSRLMLNRILSGDENEIVVGLKESRFGAGHRFAVAVRRTHRAGGAIMVNLDAAQLVEFRKQIGIGKLVNDLGKNAGIDYVVIQDDEGILAATKNVSEMSNVANDTLLRTVLDRDTTVTREVQFNGRMSFEVIQRLNVDGATVGVLRIGLSMDELRAVNSRMQRRLMVIMAVIIVLAVLIMLIVMAARNVRLISGKYSSIRSLTGDILEHMNDAVISLDVHDSITLFNRRAELMFGSTAADVTGHTMQTVPGNIRHLLTMLNAFPDGEHEQHLIVPDGEERILSVSISSTTDQAGRKEARTMVMKDLTETKRMEMEMQRNEKMSAMGELAAGVAHEIRNPLNAISMIAQRFEKEFTPKKDVREYKELSAVLKSESVRINGIVQQFLRYARPKNVILQRTGASAFIGNLSAIFRSQALRKQITFSAVSDDCILAIDPEQMTQACLNLLQNAMDATPSNGSIELSLRNIDGSITITIADNGPGIPDAQRDKIFNLYHTTKPNGSGMGLAITQQIVSQHNGSIRFRNNLPSGTAFIITLPAVSNTP